MERREQFGLLSLLSILTFSCLWTGQPSTAKADDGSIAQRSPAPICQPNTSALPGQAPRNSCAAPALERRSLTVVGLGQVTAPADVALLEFRFGSREPLSPPDTTPELSIEAARKITEAALQPAVKALTQAGVPSRNLTLQTSSLQSPALLVRVDKPTQTSLQKIVLAVNQSLKSSQSLFLQSIGAGYAVTSCQVVQRSARRIALRDAQEQLTSLAQEVGVQLGELLSVTVLPLEGSPNSAGCGSKAGVPNTPVSIAIDDATPPYTPSDQPTVQVRSQVSVTHAIK